MKITLIIKNDQKQCDLLKQQRLFTKGKRKGWKVAVVKVSQGYRFTVTEVLRATGSQREKAHESIYNTGTSGETSGAKTDKNQSIQTTLG